MPLYSRLPRRLALVVQAGIPIAITALIVWVAWLSTSIQDRFSAQTTKTRVVVCTALDRSNERALDSIVADAQAHSPGHKLDARSVAAIANLRHTYETIYHDCLTQSG